MVPIKVNGADAKVPIEELIARYQREESAEKKYQDAARIKKDATDMVIRLRENPWEALQDPLFGYSEDALRQKAEEFLYEKVQFESMTPEEQEAYEAKKKLAEYREKEKEWQQTEAQKKQEALIQKYRNQYQTMIIGALEKSTLPKNPETVRRIAAYMHRAVQNDDPINADEIVKRVHKDYEEDIKNLVSNLDEDTLYETLGKDVVTKIRKKELKKVKAKNAETKPSGKRTGRPIPLNDRKMSMQQWREKRRRMMMEDG